MGALDYDDIICPSGFGPEIEKCLKDIRGKARVEAACHFRVAGKRIGDVLKSKAKEARVRVAQRAATAEMMRLAAACEALTPSGSTVGEILRQKAKDARERLAERVIALRDKSTDIELALQMADSYTFSNTRRPAGVKGVVTATKTIQTEYRKWLDTRRSAILDDMLRPDAEKPLLQENPWGFEAKYDLFKPGSDQPVEHMYLSSPIQEPILVAAAKGGEATAPWEHEPLMKIKQHESRPVPSREPVWHSAGTWHSNIQSEKAKAHSGSVMPSSNAIHAQNKAALGNDSSTGSHDGANLRAIRTETGDGKKEGGHSFMQPKVHQNGRRKIEGASSEVVSGGESLEVTMNSRRSLQQPPHSKKEPASKRLPSLANTTGSNESLPFSSSKSSAPCPSSPSDFGMMSVWSFDQSSIDGKVCIKKRQTDSISLDAAQAVQHKQAAEKSGGHVMRSSSSFAGPPPRLRRQSTSNTAAFLPRRASSYTSADNPAIASPKMASLPSRSSSFTSAENPAFGSPKMASLPPRSSSYTSADNPAIGSPKMASLLRRSNVSYTNAGNPAIASPLMSPLLPRSSSFTSPRNPAIAPPYPSASNRPQPVDRASTAWQEPGSTALMRYDDLLQSIILSSAETEKPEGKMRCISSTTSLQPACISGGLDALRVTATPPPLLQRRRQSDPVALRMHDTRATSSAASGNQHQLPRLRCV